MKTKFSLLIFVLLFMCSEMIAQDKITIGVIQYDLSNIDKSFKDLQLQKKCVDERLCRTGENGIKEAQY